MSKRKDIPHFTSEQEEAAFWHTHDSTEYIDWSKAQHMRLPKLKPSLKTISIRLSEPMLEELKVLANKKDVPYQSLVKMLLADALARERHA
jgi:predicted DNA binding CopG/RHH family protein